MKIRMNIHNRLALALWGVALSAFVTAGAGLLLYQHLTLKQRALEIMEPYARLVAVGTDAAVAFRDPERAREILDTLQANPEILAAAIYLEGEELLASYNATPRNATPRVPPRPLPAGPNGVYLGEGFVELLRELPGEARLHLVMGLDQLGKQTRQAFWMFAAGVLILLAATLAQLAVLRRMIVAPVATLTEATEQVRARGDYTHLVPASGTDEVARLGQNFNAMLEAIREREEDLHRLSLLQRTILDNAAHGIISATPEGIVTSFNPAAQRLLGYRADEVVGKRTPALWHDREEMERHAAALSGELGEMVAPGFDVFTARPRRNLPEEGEWTFIRKDKERIPVNLTVTALRDGHGRITGFVGLVYDLTERKRAEAEARESEEKYRTLIQKIQAAVVVHGADTKILTSNAMARELLGLTEAQLMGKRAMDPHWHFFGEDGARLPVEAYPVNRVLETGKPLRNLVLGVHRPSREDHVWVLVNADPLFGEQGRILQVIVTFSDITELETYRNHLETTVRNEVQKRLAQEKVMLQQAKLAAMGELMGNIAHHWRQPLAAIALKIQEIQDANEYGELDKAGLEREVRESMDLLEKMSEEINRFSRFFRTRSEKQRFSIAKLIHEAVEISHFQDIEGLTLTIDADPEILIDGHPEEYGQALINLLHNAREVFAKREISTPKLAITLEENDEGKSVLCVTDSAGGIEEELLDKVFEPYFTTKFQSTGTGLGLYIARMMIESNMAGTITAENVEGGAEFCIVV